MPSEGATRGAMLRVKCRKSQGKRDCFVMILRKNRDFCRFLPQGEGT
jgi:hypothetical protein